MKFEFLLLTLKTVDPRSYCHPRERRESSSGSPPFAGMTLGPFAGMTLGPFAGMTAFRGDDVFKIFSLYLLVVNIFYDIYSTRMKMLEIGSKEYIYSCMID